MLQLQDTPVSKKTGTLYIDDNLDVMRNELRDSQFDLVYLDPPFNSKRNYNITFKDNREIEDIDQTKGFDDTWSYLKHQQKTDAEYKRIELQDDKLAHFLSFVKEGAAKDCNHFAYLTFMASRLKEIHRVLKPTGSVYLHVDPTESHYLKIVMDLIFGSSNFRNEIVWCYKGAATPTRGFGWKHDCILFYSKTNGFYFNNDAQEIHTQYCRPLKNEIAVRKNKTYSWVGNPLGKKVEDWWEIPILNPMSKERLGYPTQKPECLLERIISASCPTDGVILDPFCGCGTSCAVAAKRGISYVGIDVSSNAEDVIKKRFIDANVLPPKIVGKTGFTIQITVNRHLKFHNNKERGADGGVDGYQNFRLPNGEIYKSVSSIKSGGCSASQFRDFIHVISREHADLGVMVMRDSPTTTMLKEQNQFGYYKDTLIPRIQIFRVDDIINDNYLLKLPEGAVRE